MTEIYETEDGRRAVEKRYREFLARWPVPAEHLHAPTAQGETFVIACGPPHYFPNQTEAIIGFLTENAHA